MKQLFSELNNKLDQQYMTDYKVDGRWGITLQFLRTGN